MNFPMQQTPPTGGIAEFNTVSAISVGKKVFSNDEKAAIVLYTLGPIRAEELFNSLEEKDHRAFAKALHKLGYVSGQDIEDVLGEFVRMVTNDGPIRGTSSEARRFLVQVLPADMVDRIMEDVEGRLDANIWERISLAPEVAIANYLRGEQLQTAAVVLSRIKPDKAAKVMELFPEDKVNKILAFIARLGSIDAAVLDDVQQALYKDFMSIIVKQGTTRRPTDIIAALLNNMPMQRAQECLDTLRTQDEDTADQVQRTMFTFADFLTRISPVDLQKVIKAVDASVLVRALKMAKDRQPKVYDYFFANMSKRAAEMMSDEVQALPPLRAKDAEAAQTEVITITRTMAKNGEIEITEGEVEQEAMI